MHPCCASGLSATGLAPPRPSRPFRAAAARTPIHSRPPRETVHYNHDYSYEDKDPEPPRGSNGILEFDFYTIEDHGQVTSTTTLSSDKQSLTTNSNSKRIIDIDAGGSAHFWDHETAELTKLADSFDGFLDLLQPFNADDIGLKPGQVKSVWVDPDLLKEFGNG